MEEERSDEALMLAYQAGDGAAFEALYGRWRGRLYRYLLHQCGQAARAEELYQDVWMKVIGAREHYEVAAKFSTWLFRIARNRLIDHWRAAGKATEESLDGFEGEDDELPLDARVELAASGEETPSRLLERKGLAEKLVAAVNALPAVQREAFLLAEEGGMTLEEIAATTGTGRETVKSRLRYALAKLRAELKEWR